MTSRLIKLTNILLKEHPLTNYRTEAYRALDDTYNGAICPILFSGIDFNCSNCCLKDSYSFPQILTELGKVS